MLARDQAYYYKIECIKKENEMNDNPEIERLWSIKDSLNKDNVKELEKIISNYGFPTIQMVGKKAASAAFLVIQHADIKTQKKYLTVIEKLAFNNEIDKSSYALLKDRILVTDGKKQLYGSQLKTNKDGSSIFFPIEDSINVDKRRKEMGMESLNDYYKRFNRDSSIDK